MRRPISVIPDRAASIYAIVDMRGAGTQRDAYLETEGGATGAQEPAPARR